MSFNTSNFLSENKEHLAHKNVKKTWETCATIHQNNPKALWCYELTTFFIITCLASFPVLKKCPYLHVLQDWHQRCLSLYPKQTGIIKQCTTLIYNKTLFKHYIMLWNRNQCKYLKKNYGGTTYSNYRKLSVLKYQSVLNTNIKNQ